MKITRYFWDLNEEAWTQTQRTLRNPVDALFPQRTVTLLSRCDQPKELFSILPKEKFVEAWPKIRSYWIRRARHSHSRDWWETLYEQMAAPTEAQTTSRPSVVFGKVGQTIKEKRVERGLSQKQLAQQTQLSQPAISQIEEGRKNITLFTLVRICKVLGIKTLDVS